MTVELVWPEMLDPVAGSGREDRQGLMSDVTAEAEAAVEVLLPSADPVGDARSELAARLVEEETPATGIDLVAPGGLLAKLTRQVLELGLEVETTEHLGYAKHEPAGRDGGHSRNGTRSKTVITEVGSVELNVPRDRDGTSEPKTVRKRQRRLHRWEAELLLLLRPWRQVAGPPAVVGPAHSSAVAGAPVTVVPQLKCRRTRSCVDQRPSRAER